MSSAQEPESVLHGLSSSWLEAGADERNELLVQIMNNGRALGLALISMQVAVGRSIGLHPTDVGIVGHLQTLPGQPHRTPGELARLTGLTTGAITGVIDRLEAAGYVRRERDTRDRRKVIVIPTGKDVETFDKVFGPMVLAYIKLCEKYDDDELRVIAEYMAASVEITQDVIDRLRDGSRMNEVEQG